MMGILFQRYGYYGYCPECNKKMYFSLSLTEEDDKKFLEVWDHKFCRFCGGNSWVLPELPPGKFLSAGRCETFEFYRFKPFGLEAFNLPIHIPCGTVWSTIFVDMPTFILGLISLPFFILLLIGIFIESISALDGVLHETISSSYELTERLFGTGPGFFFHICSLYFGIRMLVLFYYFLTAEKRKQNIAAKIQRERRNCNPSATRDSQ